MLPYIKIYVTIIRFFYYSNMAVAFIISKNKTKKKTINHLSYQNQLWLNSACQLRLITQNIFYTLFDRPSVAGAVLKTVLSMIN